MVKDSSKMKSIEPLTDVSPPWAPRMDESTHGCFNIFGWSGWGPMIISTYLDVRTVWMMTYDSFDILGCEDGLDDNPWFFLTTYLDVRMVWMTTHDSFFGHIWMWGWCGWRPMILSFNIFGCEGSLDDNPWLFLSTYLDVRTSLDDDPWFFLSTYLDVRMVWMTTHDSFNIFGCEDSLDDNPWFLSFNIFGCEDDLDDNPWFFLSFNIFGCEDGLPGHHPK